MPPVATEVRDHYLAAQLAGDRLAALAVLDEALARGLGAMDLEVDVVASAQREIGQLWQDNRITIADEHMATAISQYALAHLYRFTLRAPRNGHCVLLACVEGEQHDVGPRIAGDLLDCAGYTVRFLGANVPTDSLLAMIRSQKPALVALSATLSLHLAALQDAVIRIRREVSAELPIVLGGGLPIDPGKLAPRVHVATGTARDFVSRVGELLGVAA